MLSQQVGRRDQMLIRVLQGALIGLGAVLPGISGGVLCVIFGVYQPIMEVLADPRRALRRHLRLLIPIGIGVVIGFLGIAKILGFLLNRYPDPSVCLFVGLIAGMLPSLYREAGEHGRGKSAFVACDIARDFTGDCAQFCLVSVLRILSGAQRHRARYELFHIAHALGAVHAVH